jgi:tRNA modification GTPase
LREGTDVDEVERIGIERAWGQIARADAVLFLHDLTRADEAAYAAADATIAAQLLRDMPPGVQVLQVWNKTDQVDPGVVQRHAQGEAAVALSARQGTGLDALRQRLLTMAGWQPAAEGLFMARERHVQSLHQVAGHLEAAADCLALQAAHLDVMAEELRLAQQALGAITGEFSADDLLGEIFSRFCIGK